MVYRKSPPQRARLVLRIVVAGAGAALITACSSEHPPCEANSCFGPGPTVPGGYDAADALDPGMVGGGVLINPEGGADVVNDVDPLPDGGAD